MRPTAIDRTCATLALAADVPMNVVSDRLGHSTMAVTANLYTAVLPAVVREAALRVVNVVPTRRGGGGPCDRASPFAGTCERRRNAIPQVRAEGVGFEPTVDVAAHSGFQGDQRPSRTVRGSW